MLLWLTAMVLTPEHVQSKIQARLSVLISPDPVTKISLVTRPLHLSGDPSYPLSLLMCFQLSKNRTISAFPSLIV